jgi:hypothetical protein
VAYYPVDLIWRCPNAVRSKQHVSYPVRHHGSANYAATQVADNPSIPAASFLPGRRAFILSVVDGPF